MNASIRTKLILSYLSIALLTALFIYGLIRATSGTRLEALILEQQIAGLRDEAADWYDVEGSWDGFLDYFVGQHPPPKRDAKRDGKIRGMHGVVTVDQRILIRTNGYEPGQQLPDVLMVNAVPVNVGGETVGYIVPDDVTGIGLAAEERIYLQRTNEVLLGSGALATILALLMGMGLARLFVRPIRDLTAASQAMASGDLDQRVPIRSKDELGQLAATFNQMSNDLANATRQRQQMTADIAHDLSTPLQVISGYVEAMQDGSLAYTPERLNTISHEISHLHHLIEDLDVLAQTDTHALTLKMEAIDPADFVRQVALSFAPLAHAENITLTTDVSTDLPTIYADEKRLMQVMGNLINNGLRYTQAGGHIAITAHAQLDHVLLQVKDDGCGINKEDLPYIFDRFYRADTSRTEGGKMGLGLAISKALIEAMGGTITAESSPDGTTFILMITS